MRARAALLVLAGASLGCSPIAGFRPPASIPDDRVAEVGGGGVVVSPRPFVDEPVRAAGQVWASTRASKLLTVTGLGAFDLGAIALGGALRADVVKTPRLALGGEAEAGLLWGAASVPFSLRIVGPVWIYTAPRLGSRGVTWAVDVPAGIDLRVRSLLSVRLEYRASWAELDPFQRRHQGGLALAWFL